MTLRRMMAILRGQGRFWLWAALVLVAVLWLLVSPLSLGLSPLVRAALLAPALCFLAGYLLQRVLFAREAWRGPSLLPIAFGLSLGVGAVAWGVARVFGSGLALMGWLWAAACTALVAWNIVADWRRGEHAPAALPRERGALWPYLLVLGVILFWTVLAAIVGTAYMSQGDDWYSMAIVRRIAWTGSLDPGDPHFPGLPSAQRGDSWLALVALLVSRSGVDTLALWNVASAFLMPVAILAHYLLGETLFKDRLAAALSCLFLMYGFGRFSRDIPMAIVLQAGVGFMLFLVALALAWRYILERSRRFLVAALLSGWALVSTHILVFAGLLAALGAFVVLHFIVHRDWPCARRALLLIGVLVLLAVPFVRTWVGSGVQTDNPIYSDDWGVLSKFGGWHILRPSALIGGSPSPVAWAFLLCPLLLLLAKRQPWALFLLSTMLFVVGTAFNPLFVELMLRLHLAPAWGLWRLVLQVFQFQFVLGGLGALALRWWFQRMGQVWDGGRFVRIVLLLTALAVSFLPSAVPLVRPLANYASLALYVLEHRATMFPYNWGEGSAYLNDQLPAGSVILTDTDTSFLVPVLTDHYVVAIPYGRTSPFVNDDVRRREDVALALDPETGMDRVLGILERYQVDYVLLVCASPPVGEASLSPERYTQLVARFAGDPVHFQPVFADEADPSLRMTVFAYTAAGD